MERLTIYLGNKNYSSWSLRAWLAARLSGSPFEERVFHLRAPGVRDEIRRVSPTGRVPALRHGERLIWDSLAIAEYLAERCPDVAMWPADGAARAAARAVAAEMHSGFLAIRGAMPMNVRRSSPGRGRTDGTAEEIERIQALWRWCRADWGGGGEFLFGAWSLADCFYAPVVSRFRTYAVELDEPCRAYADAVWARPEIRDWCAAAAAETWVVAEYDL